MPTPAEKALTYDAEFRAIRTHWKTRIHDHGETVPCWRCNQPIDSTVPYDIGHDETTGQVRGPEHRHRTGPCPGNRGEAATRGNRARGQAATPPGTPSRTW